MKNTKVSRIDTEITKSDNIINLRSIYTIDNELLIISVSSEQDEPIKFSTSDICFDSSDEMRQVLLEIINDFTERLNKLNK